MSFDDSKFSTLDQIEDQIKGFSGSTFGLSPLQRQGLLDVAKSRLSITSDPTERNDILDRTRQSISGIGGSLGKVQLGQMGELAKMVRGGSTSGLTGLADEVDPNTNWVGPKLALATGGVIPGPVDPDTGDDTTIRAKRGEYVLPVEVVQVLGVGFLDALVAAIKAPLGKNSVEHIQPHE